MDDVIIGTDGQCRCAWSQAAPDYPRYHDSEWGFPVGDDIRLFEKVCLEGFQAGLSWRTILEKREAFRDAFAGFDYRVVAGFGDTQVEALMDNPAIVRNRRKIQSVINNARRAAELMEECGSLAAFFWSFEPDAGHLPAPQSVATSPESVALSRALKKRGWTFVGPTTCYAFMQAMGLINDHHFGCVIRNKVEEARSHFVRPE
ncbi:DNA-3-methyladenine glycosylase I [Alcanivorax sp. DP30]|uniref:DNA-3-methyladenine glycosylase I n=1 Tax=Alcanivorax sp. DP30 TaxID=2606217 RepID=UPI00136BB9DC|nr:DNA-3-methyladenine glycosylase I [Alcanivorax sp. DP30]MZR61478.1 DNA-3-methyladenine glycosylase I [Alcanivorax sp. DP30]